MSALLREFSAIRDLAQNGCAAAWAVDGVRRASPTFLASLGDARMPEPDEVLLWLGNPAEEAVLRTIAPTVIDPEFRASIDALRDARDRDQALSVHVALRIALGQVLGTPPRSVCIEHGPHGKPRLSGDADLHFSLSHTRGAGGFALSRRPVGFDVEQIRSFPDMVAVAEFAFAPEMRAALASTDEAGWIALFYRFWTLGEAYIKATGLGVSQGLQTFAFAPDDPPRLLRATPGWGPSDRWRFGVL